MLKQVVILLSSGSTLAAEEVHSKMANVKRAGEVSIALVTAIPVFKDVSREGLSFLLATFCLF